MTKERSHLRTGIVERDFSEDTGEMIYEKKHRYLANSKEEFMLVYTMLWGLMQEMTLPEVRVYSYLIERYNMGVEIGMNKSVKRVMADKLKLNIRTIENTLSRLFERKLIYRVDVGMYKLNPRYAYKGSSANRSQLLKFTLEIECPNC